MEDWDVCKITPCEDGKTDGPVLLWTWEGLARYRELNSGGATVYDQPCFFPLPLAVAPGMEQCQASEGQPRKTASASRHPSLRRPYCMFHTGSFGE